MPLCSPGQELDLSHTHFEPLGQPNREISVLPAPPMPLCSPGQEVALFDGRPNGELLLATGRVELANPADCLSLSTGLVAADRLYSSKRQIVEAMGFSEWLPYVFSFHVCAFFRSLCKSMPGACRALPPVPRRL